MSLKKFGSPVKIKISKKSGFTMDINVLAERFKQDIPDKKLSVDQIHNLLKSIGVSNYQAEDLQELIGRLQAVGFKITK